MTLHVRVGGAWKEILPGTSVRVGGAWKEIMEGYVRVGGAWKQFYQSLTISLADLNANDVTAEAFSFGSAATATARVTLGTTGVLSRNGTPDADGNEWANIAVSGGDYEARLTVNSGSSPNSPGSASTGAWLSLGTQREWGVTITTINGSITGNWTLEIREAGGSVLATATFNITATVTPI